MPDNTDFNTLLTAGWYSIYSSTTAPTPDIKNRWLVKVESMTDGTSGITVQTAYFYMGGSYVAPKTRHLYYNLEYNSWSWSAWN